MPEIVGVRTGGDVDAGDVVDEVGDLVREGLCRRGALLALLEASGKGDVVKGVGIVVDLLGKLAEFLVGIREVRERLLVTGNLGA